MQHQTPFEKLRADRQGTFVSEALFDQMADSVFFIKDAAGRYVSVNKTLMLRCGKRTKGEIIGRRPTEVFDPELGRAFETQDLTILRTGQPLTDKLELHLYQTRQTGWCLTTKVPIRDQSDRIVGLVGVSRDIAPAELTTTDLTNIARAIDYANNHLSDPPRVDCLAEVAGMSLYQLDRRMRSIHGLTTGQWLLKSRIDDASRQLKHTTLRIADIATACGYTDQSTFARQFRRTTGLTPSRFRELHQNPE